MCHIAPNSGFHFKLLRHFSLRAEDRVSERGILSRPLNPLYDTGHSILADPLHAVCCYESVEGGLVSRHNHSNIIRML